MTRRILTRRQMLVGGSGTLAALLLAGCDRLSTAPSVQSILRSAESLTYRSQRLVLGVQPLAREFREADLSPVFRSNGSNDPNNPLYNNLRADNFVNWRLAVGGLVLQPLQLSLAQLRLLPARTQITRHDCVEGWSAIGQWTGVPLGQVLQRAGLLPQVRYIVFHCADQLQADQPYYESIDLIDAFHPQTLLAYDLNRKPLPVANGAPLRLRVERQLGYKHAKYLMAIEAVASLQSIRGGQGGFWEDRGYEWYAGI